MTKDFSFYYIPQVEYTFQHRGEIHWISVHLCSVRNSSITKEFLHEDDFWWSVKLRFLRIEAGYEFISQEILMQMIYWEINQKRLIFVMNYDICKVNLSDLFSIHRISSGLAFWWTITHFTLSGFLNKLLRMMKFIDTAVRSLKILSVFITNETLEKVFFLMLLYQMNRKKF